jgi:hypothetical protein
VAPNRNQRRLQVTQNDVVLSRANTVGALSNFDFGVLRIDAEVGMRILVHSGCLWVPHEEDHCSVGVSAGESFAVARAGVINAMSTRATQLELVWPAPTSAH